jgi:hypothetical protein
MSLRQKKPPLTSDKQRMSPFWNDAVQVLETASHAPHDGFSSDLALIIDSAGGLRIVTATGWSIEGLQSEYGGAVYHVTRTGHDGCVEGRAPGMSCLLRGPSMTPPLPQTAPRNLPKAPKASRLKDRKRLVSSNWPDAA